MPAVPTMPTDSYSCLLMHDNNYAYRRLHEMCGSAFEFWGGGVYGIRGTIPFQNHVHSGAGWHGCFMAWSPRAASIGVRSVRVSIGRGTNRTMETNEIGMYTTAGGCKSN